MYNLRCFQTPLYNRNTQTRQTTQQQNKNFCKTQTTQKTKQTTTKHHLSTKHKKPENHPNIKHPKKQTQTQTQTQTRRPQKNQKPHYQKTQIAKQPNTHLKSNISKKHQKKPHPKKYNPKTTKPLILHQKTQKTQTNTKPNPTTKEYKTIKTPNQRPPHVPNQTTHQTT